MAPSTTPHVLIVGAGLGGLTLAQSLRKAGISFEIFERDDGDLRSVQGWAISIHTVMDDLKAAFPDSMPSIEQTNHLLPLDLGVELAMYAQGSTKKVGVRDDTGKVLRTNRKRLRHWLATDIPVQFNKKTVAIEERDDGVTVHFSDGSSATGDIVVGADGVHSITRKHALAGQEDPIKPEPVSLITGEVQLHGQDMLDQLRLAHSAYVAEFPGENGTHHLFVGLKEVAPDGHSAHYYFHVMIPEPAAAEDGYWTYSASREELHKALLERTKELPERLRVIVDKLPVEGVRVPPLRFNTLVLPSLPVGRVTLLGDAAHAMTPFRGEGGVHAMQDGMKLARAIAQIDGNNLESIKEHLGAYQEEMLARGGRAAQLSRLAFDKKLDVENPGEDRQVAGEKMMPLPDEPVTLKFKSTGN